MPRSERSRSPTGTVGSARENAFTEDCKHDVDQEQAVTYARADPTRSRSPSSARRLTYRDFLPTHRAKLSENTKRRLWDIIEEKRIGSVPKSSSKQDLVCVILEGNVIEQLHNFDAGLDKTLPPVEINRLLTQKSNELLLEY